MQNLAKVAKKYYTKKMILSRTLFFKNIRVNSKDELRQRILKGIEEINAAPAVHRWKKFDFVKN